MRHLPFIFASLLATAGIASAETIYVSPTGNGTAPTAGFATGFAHIEEAFAFAAPSGDTILLDRGTHSLTNNNQLNITKSFTLCGVGTRDETIIDGVNGKNNQWSVQSSAKGGFWHTFTMIHMGSAYSGSLGITALNTTTISNCVFRENGNTYNGNARYVLQAGSSTLVTHCWITNNIAPNCPGISLTDNSIIENCYIADNVNKGGNVSWRGVVAASKNATVRNCTIVNNKSANDVVYCGSGTAKFYNNIIWGNTFYSSPDANNWSASTLGTCAGNCTTPLMGSAENGNTAEDPLLREDNMHFSAASPCHGTAVAEFAPAIDIDLTERGEHPSIGAYEYVASSILSCSIVASATAALEPETITLSCALEGATGDAVSYLWDFDGDGITDSTAASPVLADIGVYTPSVIITDGANRTATATYPSPVIIYSADGNVYVTAAENPNARPPFATWETAATNLNEALTYALAGSSILLDEGTHYLTGTVEINKTLTIASTNGPERTFLAKTKKAGAVQLFISKNQNAVIDGFTIQNGNFSNYAQGAIIALEAGTVRNCRFLNNTVVGHGAVTSVASDYSITIEKCVFIGNNANGSQGPACIKTNNGKTTISDSLFVANTNSATGGGYTGGAIFLASANASILNCTLVGNVAVNQHEAGIHNANGGTVRNCIVAGNFRKVDGEYIDANDIGVLPAKISYNCVFPTATDYSSCTGIISEDPVFKNPDEFDFTLKFRSPCINVGDNTGILETATDLLGNPRIHLFDGNPKFEIVDLGCYESPFYKQKSLMFFLR